MAALNRRKPSVTPFRKFRPANHGPASPHLPAGPRFNLLHAWSFFNRPRRFYSWLRHRYGEITTLPSASGPFVITLTAAGAREVLTKDPNGYSAFHKVAFTGLTGPGSLWVLEGGRHRRERQLLSPWFNAQNVRRYGETIQQIALRNTDAWSPGQRISGFDTMLDISLDVILSVTFGIEHGGIMKDGRNALQNLLKSIHPITSYFPTFQAWWFPPWVRYQRAKREFAEFVVRFLTERRTAGNKLSGVLGAMLADRNGGGPPLGDGEITDELITILVSGHETTAIALSWALYELARHPAVLQRLREELDVLGCTPAPEQIVKQRYLGAVCDETLRLHTILTEVGRIADAPCQLLGFTVPAGTGIGIGISAVHQDPTVYPEPDQFRPERFLERDYNAFEFLPFGGGHRRCLGATLSDFEFRIVLATIVSRWELELAGEEKEVRHAIATGPKYGVRMRVNGRRTVLMPRPSTLPNQTRDTIGASDVKAARSCTRPGSPG